MRRLAAAHRLEAAGDSLSYIYYNTDFPYSKVTNLWSDTYPVQDKEYVVQTSTFVINRCLLMATDPGDLVLDPTCGSGTTAMSPSNGAAAGSPSTLRVWRWRSPVPASWAPLSVLPARRFPRWPD